jgi:hypothetical protein
MVKSIVAAAFALGLGVVGAASEANAACVAGPSSQQVDTSPGSFTSGYKTCTSPLGRQARVWVDTGCQQFFGCKRGAVQRTGSCTAWTSVYLQRFVYTVGSGSGGWAGSSADGVCGIPHTRTVSGNTWVSTARCQVSDCS